MENIYCIKLDKHGSEPMYIQLADAIYNLIEQGAVKPEQKLPPIRRLAEALCINSSTVISAYKQLESKKAVYSRVGSGTYAALLKYSSEPVIEKGMQALRRSRADIAGKINFAGGSPPELFPADEFKQALNEVLDRDKGKAFGMSDLQGFLPLRKIIAEKLKNRGIRTLPDRIQIISGAQQGIDIVARALLKQSDVVFVERPTYYGAVGAILSRGARIIEIDISNDGIDIDKLEYLLKLYHPKFIYVMPEFQTPTGISYSIEKKRKLLELANSSGVYIVEEDNLSDFNYSSQNIVPLKALDYRGRVIYIKSFSKVLSSGLRLGYMVLPRVISEAAVCAKYASDISTSAFLQRAFDIFLRNGCLDTHILKMRSIFSEKYAIMFRELSVKLDRYIDFSEPKGGLSFWAELKGNFGFSSEQLCSRLSDDGVLALPDNIYYFGDESNDTVYDKKKYLRLSFACISADDISRGVDIIAKALSEENTV